MVFQILLRFFSIAVLFMLHWENMRKRSVLIVVLLNHDLTFLG